MWDREVYVQMKRITGEDGTCWTSRSNLAKQCGISVRRLDKSIEYLVEHKWIEKVGTKKVNTKGGAQEVNEYKIADLWKMNMDYYESLKGGAPETQPSSPKGVHGKRKGYAPGAHKEEPMNNIPILAKANAKRDNRNMEVQEIIDTLTEQLGTLPMDGTQKENRRYSKLLIDKLKKSCESQGYETSKAVPLAKSVVRAAFQGWHAKNATSVKYIYYNMGKIIQESKTKSLNVLSV